MDPEQQAEFLEKFRTEAELMFRLSATLPAVVRPLEEVRDEIRNRLYEQKFTPEFERFISQLKEDAYIQIFGDK